MWQGKEPEDEFSAISPQDAALPTSGNRFDVAGGGVMYVASQKQGAFAETMARFRPSPRFLALKFEDNENLMTVGSLPSQWRMDRSILEIKASDPLSFLDVDDTETHMFLSREMAPTLESLGVVDLDVSVVRGSNRLISRAIADYAYSASNEDGDPIYSGLRYGSRLGDYECWAIFDGTDFDIASREAVDIRNDDMRVIADKFDLVVH